MSALSVRHEVLKRLGLKQWYSKFNLPNAADTPPSISISKAEVNFNHSELNKDSVGIFDSINEQVSKSELISGKTLLKEMLAPEELTSDASFVSNIVETSSVSAELIESIDVVEKIPSLSLSVGFYNTVLVFQELDSSSNLELEQRLIENIFKSFNLNSELLASGPVFKWPVFKSEALIFSQAPLFSNVFKRWASNKTWSQVNYVIYFGKNYEKLKPLFLEVQSEFNEESILVPYKLSLTDVLRSPSAKKKLWSLLLKVGLRNE